MEIAERLNRIEEMLAVLIGRQKIQDWYTTAEAAQLLGKAEFTVREWARLGRIRASKRMSGRGAYPSWAIAHEEILRYQKEGLLPLPESENTRWFRG
jgi:excisionase family DNA binding protein